MYAQQFSFRKQRLNQAFPDVCFALCFEAGNAQIRGNETEIETEEAREAFRRVSLARTYLPRAGTYGNGIFL